MSRDMSKPEDLPCPDKSESRLEHDNRTSDDAEGGNRKWREARERRCTVVEAGWCSAVRRRGAAARTGCAGGGGGARVGVGHTEARGRCLRVRRGGGAGRSAMCDVGQHYGKHEADVVLTKYQRQLTSQRQHPMRLKHQRLCWKQTRTMRVRTRQEGRQW